MNEVEKFKKDRKSKQDKSKQQKRLVRDVTDRMKHESGDPYALNRIHNNRYRDWAEDNKVTGLKSLIHELELRWMANPNLGGRPEGPTLWDEINRPSDPTAPVNNIINRLLEKIK